MTTPLPDCHPASLVFAPVTAASSRAYASQILAVLCRPFLWRTHNDAVTTIAGRQRRALLLRAQLCVAQHDADAVRHATAAAGRAQDAPPCPRRAERVVQLHKRRPRARGAGGFSPQLMALSQCHVGPFPIVMCTSLLRGQLLLQVPVGRINPGGDVSTQQGVSAVANETASEPMS